MRGFFFAIRPTIQAETATASPKNAATAARSSTTGQRGSAARNARPYASRAQARIEDRDDAAVGVAADQPAEALPQLEHRGRQRVVAEPVAAARARPPRSAPRAAGRPAPRTAACRSRAARATRPGTSTPCQNVDVASSTESTSSRKRSSSRSRGASPWTSTSYGTRPRTRSRYGVERAVARREHERAALGEREQRHDLLGGALGERRRCAGRASCAARRAAPARGSRTASRRRARARRSSPSRRRTNRASSPVVSVAETRIAVGPSSQSRSRSSSATSTGAQASASGSAQTTRSSSPGSRQASTCAATPSARRDERVEILALPVQRVGEIGERVDRGRAPARPAARAAGGGPTAARPRAAAARRRRSTRSSCARRERAAAPRGTRARRRARAGAGRRARRGRRARTRPTPRAGAPRRRRPRRARAARRRRRRGRRSRARGSRSRARPRRRASRAASAKHVETNGQRRPDAAVGADGELRPERVRRLELELGAVAGLGLVEPGCIASQARPSRPSGSSERLEALQLAAAEVVLAALERPRPCTSRPSAARRERHVLARAAAPAAPSSRSRRRRAARTRAPAQVREALPDARPRLGDEVLARARAHASTAAASAACSRPRLEVGQRARERAAGAEDVVHRRAAYASERMFPLAVGADRRKSSLVAAFRPERDLTGRAARRIGSARRIR